MPRAAPSCTPFRLLALSLLSLLHLRLFFARYFPAPPAPFRDCPNTAADVSALRSTLRKCQGELVHRRQVARSTYNENVRGAYNGAALAGGADQDERWLAESAVSAAAHGGGGGGEAGADVISAEHARRQEAHLTRLRAERLSNCAASDVELKRYLHLSPHATCPDDWQLAHRLRFTDHCHVIPPRPCLSPIPPDPAEPPPLPEALWTPLDGRSVRWERYGCADVACVERQLAAFAAGAAADAAAVAAVARVVNSSLVAPGWGRGAGEGNGRQGERGKGRGGRTGGGGADVGSGCDRDGWAAGVACFRFTQPSGSNTGNTGSTGSSSSRGSGSRGKSKGHMAIGGHGSTAKGRVAGTEGAGHDFRIGDLMRLKGGGMRLGLDLGGGTGQFAAQMALHNVTILTLQSNLLAYPTASHWLPHSASHAATTTTTTPSSSSSSSATSTSSSSSSSSRLAVPFQEAIAWRGLLAMDVPLTARLPLFDSSLDLIHATGTAGPALLQGVDALSPREFHLALFDWHRVLRPGGVLWLEAMEQSAEAMPLYEAALERLCERVGETVGERVGETVGGGPGYRRLFARKVDAEVGGVRHRHVQRLWVVLEKPVRRMAGSGDVSGDVSGGGERGGGSRRPHSFDPNVVTLFS